MSVGWGWLFDLVDWDCLLEFFGLIVLIDCLVGLDWIGWLIVVDWFWSLVLQTWLVFVVGGKKEMRTIGEKRFTWTVESPPLSHPGGERK